MRNNFHTSLAAISIACLAAPVLAQSAPMTYRDWSVTCNNIKTCMAYSASSTSEGVGRVRPRGMSDDVPEGWMTIERAAGPNSVARILISRPNLESTQIPADAELHLLDSNGRSVSTGVFAATMGDRSAIEIHPSVQGQFLSAARAASHVVFVVGGVKRPVFFVSLSGLVASGRNIDARQGRTNTQGALIDIGQISNSRVPVAPPLPIVIAQAFVARAASAPPASLISRRMTECDDFQTLSARNRTIESYRLNRTQILWSVACNMGAYNTWNRYYIQSPRDVIAPAKFIGSGIEDRREANSLVNTGVDPAKGLITAFSKARGVGDCGSDETYAWNGQAFVLATRIEMAPCGGIIADFWPSVVASRIVTR